jgi:hypothetical protein
MPRNRVRTVKKGDMSADHPRIIPAVNAGRRLADERSAADSWDLPTGRRNGVLYSPGSHL